MHRWLLLLGVMALACGGWGRPTVAQARHPTPFEQCRSAIQAAERAGALPGQLLAAIADVETGRRDPATGLTSPWPWTVNADGQGYVFDTEAEAIAAVKALQAQGIRSIDVGCLQVNLLHHPDAFPTLEAAFDPATNARYAARFLGQLYSQTGDWAKAAANYHSANPGLGADYQRKVLAAWPTEQRIAGTAASMGDTGGSPLAAAWAATMPPGTVQPGGRVVVQLPVNRAELPRVITLPAPPGTAGRSLAAYRATPIAVLTRPTRAGG
ncbi:transglycosylase SLT domain-containing protein [Acidisphaera rubrifaciens]|uniref:Lytic transglycosylase n=1 Tax=Acidisphaera rubrifaciens HS-AP3 TaxID=1231350 RepID=A0A0D6P2Z6_9PROT|nr:transglycosylase SLT domain-containing protein [Acidisphaera rubrifaciens]GAN76052.1 lytic transglycosylase [Acidisphaera rubrifaciens HS-AP3]